MDATPTVIFHLPPDEAAFVEVVLARRRELLALADNRPGWSSPRAVRRSCGRSRP